MKSVNIVNKSHHPLPKYSTVCSAGMDLRACITENIIIKPMERKLIKTGIAISIPENYEVQIRPRSGLALKHGVTVLNTPGTIDADYRNGWGVILINYDLRNSFKVYQGDRIAQAVLAKVEQIEWQEVSELDSTDRGLGGFGSTGSN